MKIRHAGTGRRSSSSVSRSSTPNSNFRTMLQDEIDAASDVSTSQEQGDANTTGQQPWALVEDAARLLDMIIDQIETDGKPDPASIHSLQQVRIQLTNEGNAAQHDIDTVLAVEAERLRSW